MAESFNSWIGEARSKPVVDLIDMIRGMLMEQKAERKIKSANWRGELVPFVDEYLRELTTHKEYYLIRQSTTHKAEVEGRFDREEVDIEAKECTCRVWQMTGLPCIHAAAFIGTKEHPMWHLYVDQSYNVHRYQMAYEGAIATLVGKGKWTSNDDNALVFAPNTLRPRGRPKKRRIKNFLESTSKKATRIDNCGRCDIWGHHRSTCKNPLSQGSAPLPGVDSDANISEYRHGFRAKLSIRREPA